MARFFALAVAPLLSRLLQATTPLVYKLMQHLNMERSFLQIAYLWFCLCVLARFVSSSCFLVFYTFLSSIALDQNEIEAFKAMTSLLKCRSSQQPLKFVKKLDESPLVNISSLEAQKTIFTLSGRAIVGNFIGLWPSPKEVVAWIFENWKPKLQNLVSSFVVGICFSMFIFGNKEERDLILHLGPFFIESCGMFLGP